MGSGAESWDWNIIAGVFGALLGAALGSFSCCQVWRLRYKEKGKKSLGQRSVCLKCGKQLRWFENIPVVSWVAQRGRCRHCGKKIGSMEIWSELAGMVLFGLMGWKIGGEYVALKGAEGAGWRLAIEAGLMVAVTVVLLILAIYDAKWKELPEKMLVVANVLAGILMMERLVMAEDKMSAVLGVIGAVAVLAGIYYLLYLFSKERLVGGGDWILGLAIGMALGDAWLAIWTLFLANFLGAMVMMPLRKRKIAFGPFLVGVFGIVWTFSEMIAGYL